MATLSDATKAALDAALAAHIADECDGGIISGYVLQAAYFSTQTIEHGSTGYMREFAEDQPYHSGYGLAMHLLDYYRVPERFDPEDDDD